MKTTEKQINWKASKADYKQIAALADRAVKLAEKHGVDYIDYSTAQMDLLACHCNGMPLDLDKLASADDFNFAHDVFGIARHINRETGKIERFFVPRCSRH